MAAKKNITLKLQEEKATKNTIRYAAEDEGAEIPYLYIHKDGVKYLGNPKAVQITVEAATK